MLTNLRKFSKTILAKVLMVIIVIPFVFWGMGGVFSSGNTNSLAKINKYNISTEDLTDHFREAKLDLETLRKNIDNNIIEEALGNLVTTTLLEMEIENLSLHISEKVLINSLLKSRLTFLSPVDLTKVINTSDCFLRLIVHKMINYKLNEHRSENKQKTCLLQICYEFSS